MYKHSGLARKNKGDDSQREEKKRMNFWEIFSTIVQDECEKHMEI